MKGYKVETYNLRTHGGMKIRKATKVICPDGKCIRFTEKMSKREAIRNAKYQRNKTKPFSPYNNFAITDKGTRVFNW